VTYTVAAVVAVLLALGYDLVVSRTGLLRRRAFWTAYAIMAGFQLLVNGVLTGVPVVRYDSRRVLGARLAYAPVEDLMFGFAMILTTLATWVWLGRRAAHESRAGSPPTRRARAGEVRPRRDG
jgi:lycopene cyclase domain-containing protein